MTMLRAFVCFMLVTSTSAVYEIEGHLVCGSGPESYKITTDNADGQVWVELYYMERDALQIYCTPFHVGGHEYEGANQINVGGAKGIECINRCIARSEMYKQINAVTFYHGHPGCFCVKERHYDSTAGMSTCNIKRENDMMAVNRTKHGKRVSRNAKQIHSLGNDDNYIHLEGSAGRSDHAFWIMVKVSNYQCNGNTWHAPAPPEVTLGKNWQYGDGNVDWSKVIFGKLILMGKIIITSSSSGGHGVYEVVTGRSNYNPYQSRCTTFSYAAGDRSKEVKCKKMTMAIWLHMEKTSGNRPLKELTVKVYEAELTQLLNVASRKKTSRSGGPSSHAGEKAIDGNYDTYVEAYYTTFFDDGLAEDFPVYWSVDLKELIIIGKIVIHLNKEFYKEERSYTDMKVLTNRWNFLTFSRSNPTSWTVCKEIGKELSFTGADTIVRTEVTCDKRTKARTVRIQNPNDQHLWLNEVEVFEDAMWFRPPYDCFDTLTSKFGCKDLVFDLDTGEVTKDSSSGSKTHKAAEADGGYYTIKNKMFDGELFAGYDHGVRVALIHTELSDDYAYRRLRDQTQGNILQWQIVKQSGAGKSESGNDYYKIISKEKNKPLYPVTNSRMDNGMDRMWTRAVEVGDDNYTPQGDRELWEFLKQGDGYYKIVNKDLKKPLFATPHYSAHVPNRDQHYSDDGKEVWDLTKV